MKQIIKTIFATLLTTTLFAQAPDVQFNWSKAQKVKEMGFSNIIDIDEKYFYTYGYEKGGLFSKGDLIISKYSLKDFSVKYSVAIPEFEYLEKDVNFRNGKLINGKINLFFMAYHSSNDESYLLRIVLDDKGDASDLELVSTVEAKRKYQSGRALRYSSDTNNILVYSDLPYERKEDEKFQLQVFDRNFKEKWKKIVQLPYSDKSFSIKDEVITNNGDVFLIGYATPDRKKGERRVRGASNQAYKLFRITKDDDDIIEYDLGLEDKFISSLDISADFGENQMAIAGFYSDEEVGAVNGSFYITIDQQKLNTITASSEPFTKKFKANFMSERRARKDKELGIFKVKDFIKRSDNGAVLVAEQSYTYTVTTSTPNGGTTTTTYYVYNDIIIVNISPDGKIDWTAHVPKKQTTTDGGYFLGYVLLVNEDKLHFVFNDHRKNLKRLAEGKDLRVYGGGSKTVAILSTVDNKGNVVRDELFSSKDAQVLLVPRRSRGFDKNKALFFAMKRRNGKFGTMAVFD